MNEKTSKIGDLKKAAMDTIMKDAIFNATVSVLAEHSLHDLTVNMVAEAAGVSKGTLYNYYRNKTELLSEVHGRLTKPVRAEMQKIVGSDLAPAEKIAATTRMALNFCDVNKVVLLAFEDSVFEKAKWEEKQCFFEELVRSILDEGVERGDFRAMDTHRTAKLLLYFLTGVIEQKLAYREPIDVEIEGGVIADLLLKGLFVRDRERAQA